MLSDNLPSDKLLADILPVGHIPNRMEDVQMARSRMADVQMAELAKRPNCHLEFGTRQNANQVKIRPGLLAYNRVSFAPISYKTSAP